MYFCEIINYIRRSLKGSCSLAMDTVVGKKRSVLREKEEKEGYWGT
jgi:hypothetical protein